MLALTEDGEIEICGVIGTVLVDILADKHRLVISVVGDGVSEGDASVGCFVGNFG